MAMIIQTIQISVTKVEIMSSLRDLLSSSFDAGMLSPLRGCGFYNLEGVNEALLVYSYLPFKS
jgi:hypothetical protein